MIIVISTLFLYWVIGFVIACINEDVTIYWATGLVYPLAVALTYPYRAIHNYKAKQKYYQKNNISMLQYLLGKRIKEVE
jgi:hypothetical protein